MRRESATTHAAGILLAVWMTVGLGWAVFHATISTGRGATAIRVVPVSQEAAAPEGTAAPDGVQAVRNTRREPKRTGRRHRARAHPRAVKVASRVKGRGHSLPVPAVAAAPHELDNKHHDYPALDLSLRNGTRVLAVTPGKVKKRTFAGRCGKGVIIKGADDMTYTYCHGSKLLVREGRRVDAGHPIMRSGNTGNSTGPHLHLQVQNKWGNLVCPQHMLRGWKNGKELSHREVGSRRCVRR